MKNIILFCSLFFFYNCHAQFITTIAGTGVAGYNGDGILAADAQVYAEGLAIDNHDNLIIADAGNQRIRKINSSGIISTIGGTGTPGYSGDGGPATAAQLFNPCSVAVDKYNNIYVADMHNNCIRKIDTFGIITTIAGGGTNPYVDGEMATATGFSECNYVAVDTAENIYISGGGIYEVNTSGIVNTFASFYGSGGLIGDGGPATEATLDECTGVVADNVGNVYINNSTMWNRVRKVNTSKIINTIAGDTCGFSGDGGISTAALLCFPSGLKIDKSGNIFFADADNYRVRVISTAGIINTIAGNGVAGFSGDGDRAVLASLDGPLDIAIDSHGGVYIADVYNYRIRYVTNTVATPLFNKVQPGILLNPNPSSGDFNVTVTTAANEEVKIVVNNILGERLLCVNGSTNKQLPVHLTTPPGIYFLTAVTQQKTETQKIIIR